MLPICHSRARAVRIHSLAVFGVCTALALQGCATSAGTIPVPPSDRDLSNDGSPGAQDALRREYAVGASRGQVDIGGGVRARRGGGLPADVQNYLKTDAEAAALLPSMESRIGTSRLVLATVYTGLGAMLAGALGGFLVSGTTFLAVNSVRATSTAPGTWETSLLLAGVTMAGLLAALGVAMFGVLLAVPILLGGMGATYLRDRSLRAQEDEAVGVFNQHLEARIKNAGTPATTPVTP